MNNFYNTNYSFLSGKLDNFYNHYKKFFIGERVRSLFVGIVFFVISLIIQSFANNYVSALKGVPVNDMFLDNLPTFDLDFIIIQGALIITLLLIYLFLTKPKYIIFGLKSLSIFIIVRSFFITLTHLGTNPSQLLFDQNSFGFQLYNILYNMNNDYFFSGHTGLPFLMALVFWPEKKWRYAFIFVSIISGTSVLLAHIHYSIDVFAAPFITYSIFSIARKIFPKDYKASREFISASKNLS